MKLKDLKENFYFKLSITLLSLLALCISSLNLYIDEKLPNEQQIRKIELQIPLKIFSSDQKLIGEFGEKRRSEISFKNIPPYFVQSVLAAEDDNFFYHSGVSYLGLIRSFYRLLISGRVQGGGSTITMQVAGNYLTGREVSFYRKIKDIFLAYRLEETYTKEEIFEFYVNRIFFGNRAYGISAASEVYYGKSISELNLAQWAMIASLPQAPSKRNPLVNPKRALIRRNWILKRMLDLGFIYQDQFDLASNAPLTASYHGLVSEVSAPYVAENIRRFMIEKYGLNAYQEGYEVYTTINSKMQNSAVSAVREGLESYDKRHGFRSPENLKDLFNRSFFETSVSERLNLIESSVSYDIGDLNEDVLEEVFAYLNSFTTTETKFPGVVIGLDKSLIVLTGNRKIHTIGWSEDLTWIRPYINENRRGPKHKNFAEFLKEGDLIWIEKDRITSNLSLAQIPEVQGSLVALDPRSGAIKALVGGYDFYLSKFDRATQSTPLLGSNFKPFLYAAALSEGFIASSVINDAPIVFEDEILEEKWRPRNASGRFFGPTRLREGLVQSRNLVSIRLLRELGIDKARNYSMNFGCKKETLQPDLSLALGTASLSPLNNAAAYAVFTNGGKKAVPYFIEKIKDRSGKIIFEKLEEDLERVIDPRVAYIIKDILQEAGRRGTARKIRELKRNDFAGKTGTTNEAESTWFTGFNNSIVTSVWVGFDNPKSLGNREFGSTTALPIWLDFIGSNKEDIPKDNALAPSGLISVKINKSSGKRASNEQEDIMFEYYLEEFPPIDPS